MPWDLPHPHLHRTVALDEHIDAYGHVNNAVYVRWLDECAWSHSTALGVSIADCRALGRGMAVWRTQINYLNAARAGDGIEVGTWILRNDARLRIDRRFEMRRAADDVVLLRALIHYACIDLASGRPVRMPRIFAEQYAVRADIAALAGDDFQPGVERSAGRGGER